MPPTQPPAECFRPTHPPTHQFMSLTHPPTHAPTPCD
jgi:hypothetical protein